MLETLKQIFMAVVAAVLVLAMLAPKFPNVRWLQRLRLNWPPMSEEERALRERRDKAIGGVQMILGGLVLPFLYLFGQAMTMSDIHAGVMAGCVAVGVALVVGGIVLIWRSR